MTFPPNITWNWAKHFGMLAAIYLAVTYAMLATKLFPSHDAFNNYVQLTYSVINSLTQGDLLLWNPAAACGSPTYLFLFTIALLDPIFFASVAIGKALLLDILQTYMVWIFLRNVPVLVGLYWLIRQQCRNQVAVVLSTGFLFTVLSACLMADHIVFIIYWPLMLACLVHFLRSALRTAPSPLALLGFALCLGISLQLYNPAYTCVLLLVLGLSRVIASPRGVTRTLLALRRVRPYQWIAGILLLTVTLLPALCLITAYSGSDYFAYLRCHQDAWYRLCSQGPLASRFLGDSLERLAVDFRRSPAREMTELASCFFPFYYNPGYSRMEGNLYFGYLGVLGILAGLFFLRNRAFVTFGLSALMLAFLMSHAADGLLSLASLGLPFLKALNQRHLLYPAFLICAGVASCIGLRLLVDPRMMKRIGTRYFPVWSFLVCVIALAGCGFFIWLGGRPAGEVVGMFFSGVGVRLQVVFVVVTVSLAVCIRASVSHPRVSCAYAFVVFLVFAVDLGCLYSQLTRYYHRRDGVLGQSEMLRTPRAMEYQPYRSPVLPMVFGTGVVSMVNVAGLRTAAPAYWHSDIGFSMPRYYELLSALSVEKLRSVLAVESPIVRIFSRWHEASSPHQALSMMRSMATEDLAESVIVEDPEKSRRMDADMLESLITPGRPIARKDLMGMGLVFSPNQSPPETSLQLKLFDSRAIISVDSLEEFSLGYYHKRAFLVPFSQILPTTPDGQVDPARSFFPDFPYALDVRGRLCYFSSGNYFTGNPSDRNNQPTMMMPLPGKGFLLEPGGDGPPTTPTVVCFQRNRHPLPQDVNVISYGPNRMEIITDRPDAGMLSVADLYDKYWTATVDGRPAKMLIANYAFKAVELTPGRHHVVFSYRVPYLYISLALYLLATGLVPVVGLVLYLFRRPSRLS